MLDSEISYGGKVYMVSRSFNRLYIGKQAAGSQPQYQKDKYNLAPTEFKFVPELLMVNGLIKHFF